ncbi:toxin-antitoxin system YwqK family antitoxin [Aestuariibaculum suncheonense]|uniref:Toxin-antitoxin system YwqK family antitoxin n=1 Tax=Aestuariibaculum suncheonense TaxID=1028745 RepID=A0A8J6QJ36_9FLAO|nr:toxin-antitoxin system YwqK family antitoxin [Aestuariibaculum suncheonense]MBD0835896.1 toxin-antitoxin system YwqK family antitoxin [Aestuariibaculum suncheonense]
MKLLHLTLVLFITSFVSAQSINQLDANGKRDGIWKKNFDGTNVLRYEGEFTHGKETGLFKFYKNIKNKAVLTATKKFNPQTNIAEVTFYGSTGKVISEGKMNGKLYIGEWKYYQKNNNNLLILEHYNLKGELEGERVVYYENGVMAEKQNYKAGVLDGEALSYSESNKLINRSHYVNGVMDGKYVVYALDGTAEVEGQFKQGQKSGIWKYYENGNLKEQKNFD